MVLGGFRSFHVLVTTFVVCKNGDWNMAKPFIPIGLCSLMQTWRIKMFILLNKSFCYVRFCVVSKNNHKLLLDFWITFIFLCLKKKQQFGSLPHWALQVWCTASFQPSFGTEIFCWSALSDLRGTLNYCISCYFKPSFSQEHSQFFLREESLFDTPNDFEYKVHIVSTTMEVKEELI